MWFVWITCVCVCLFVRRVVGPQAAVSSFPRFPCVFCVCLWDDYLIWTQSNGRPDFNFFPPNWTNWAADLPWVWTFPTLVFIVFPPGPRESQHFTSCNKVPKKRLVGEKDAVCLNGECQCVWVPVRQRLLTVFRLSITLLPLFPDTGGENSPTCLS